MNPEHADFIFLWIGRLMGIGMAGLLLLWVWTAMLSIFLQRARFALSFLAFLRFEAKIKGINEAKKKIQEGP